MIDGATFLPVASVGEEWPLVERDSGRGVCDGRRRSAVWWWESSTKGIAKIHSRFDQILAHGHEAADDIGLGRVAVELGRNLAALRHVVGEL